MTSKRIDYQACYDGLVARGGATAIDAVAHWEKRRDLAEVIPFVKSFAHEALFQITSDEVRCVLDKTEHALGDVESNEQLAFVENFSCPFALHHLFHRLVERTCSLPTWQRFWRWMNNQAKDKWIDPLWHSARLNLKNISNEEIERAIRWRMGKFYYSAIREIEFLSSMRERNIDLNYHVLADVLLRADFWTKDHIICIYFPNKIYRTEISGRKPPASRFFESASPPFNIIDFGVESFGYGRAWLIKDKSKDELANLLAV